MQEEKNRKLHKHLAAMREELTEADRATMSDALIHVSTSTLFSTHPPNPPSGNRPG
jgi:hypothetical protein